MSDFRSMYAKVPFVALPLDAKIEAVRWVAENHIDRLVPVPMGALLSAKEAQAFRQVVQRHLLHAVEAVKDASDEVDKEERLAELLGVYWSDERAETREGRAALTATTIWSPVYREAVCFQAIGAKVINLWEVL